FLKLAENWVSAVYSSTAHSVWGQPFPGGNESSCGCDPNNFKQEAGDPVAQTALATAALKNSFPQCSNTVFLNCITVTNDTLGATGELGHEIDGFGSERTEITLRVWPAVSDAQFSFKTHADSFRTPPVNNVPPIQFWRTETFPAVAGQADSGVLDAWLSPNPDSTNGSAFGVLICGNLNANFTYTLYGTTPDQGLVDKTQALLKAMMIQLGGALAGAGACNPGAAPVTNPAPAPSLTTVGKIDGFLETAVLHAGQDQTTPLSRQSLEGIDLHYGDTICFKGSGTLNLTWWDGSTVSLSEGDYNLAYHEHCLEVGVKHPENKTGPGTFLATPFVLGRAIRARILGPGQGKQSQAEIDDFNVSVKVKGTQFVMGSDPVAGATVVCTQEGVVTVTPNNSSLAPLDLSGGSQVQVTTDAVGPITPGCTLPSSEAIPQPATNLNRMTLQAAQRYVLAGDTVLVPVWLVKGKNLANLNLEIHYDPSVIQPVGDAVKGDLLDNVLFSANLKRSGSILLGLARTGALEGTGTVVEIPFKVVGKPGDVTPLLLTVTAINDPNGGVLPIDRIPGEITVVNDDGTLPPVPGGPAGSGPGGGGPGGNSSGSGNGGTTGGGIQKGDCDGDGHLTEVDALCALEMSTGARTPRLYMDLDGDGSVTSRDAVIILQQAVGQ
ncbi:MAG: cohesin domain-containing protein, partial [Anaerolineae bacterium]